MSELKPCPFCGTDLSEFPQVMTVKPVRTDEYLLYGMPVEQLFSTRNNDKLSEERNPQSGETYKEYKLRVFPRYQGVNIRPRKGVRE